MAILERKQLGLVGRPALLVIDVTRGFTDQSSPLGSDAESVVAAIQRLLEVFRKRGLPVFYTTVAFDAPMQARVFRAKLPALDILTPGSKWVDIDPRIKPRDGEPVIVKHSASGFFGTDLAQQLVGAGVESVFVTGLTTSGCVRATAVDALQHNFRVIVPREAVGDRDLSAHEANLHDIDCKYGDVVSMAKSLDLLETAGRS